jgi:hypothetical protein
MSQWGWLVFLSLFSFVVTSNIQRVQERPSLLSMFLHVLTSQRGCMGQFQKLPCSFQFTTSEAFFSSTFFFKNYILLTSYGDFLEKHGRSFTSSFAPFHGSRINAADLSLLYHTKHTILLPLAPATVRSTLSYQESASKSNASFRFNSGVCRA